MTRPNATLRKTPFVRKGSAAPTAEAFDAALQNKEPIGSVVSVSGSHALIMLSNDIADKERSAQPQLGATVSIDAGQIVVLGLVSSMRAEADGFDEISDGVRLVEVEFIGEFTKQTINAPARFRRGVSAFPGLGDEAHLATRDELTALFSINGASSVRIGSIKQDSKIPSSVNVDELFSRHFAILGSTGSGKSCTLALLTRNVLDRYPFGHIVIIDPHNEYKNSFEDRAEIFDTSNLTLPYWMLTFDELVEVLYPGKTANHEEIEVLADLIPAARRMHLSGVSRPAPGRLRSEAAAVTVDSPLPYRISEVLALIEKTLGALDNARSSGPYKRVRNRLQAISQDSRYSFMFGGLTVQDNLPDILGQIFRIPVNDKPISIIELDGMPSEVVQVVVSVITRFAYEFASWSRGAVPIAVLCEDAHRFAPADPSEGFAPTRWALTRIAKEGRKAGASLWLASQRPTELDPNILSQCNTIFAMRLTNQRDQEALRAAAPDASSSLLNCLPSLGTGEALAFGEGVPMPTRIRFDALPPDAVPRSMTASFSDGWSVELDDEDFVKRTVQQWRAQRVISPEIE